MDHFLLLEERQKLEQQPRKEFDHKKGDRRKAVLGADADQSYAELAKILLIGEATVRGHVDDSIASKKKGNDSGESGGNLSWIKILNFKENFHRATCPTWPKPSLFWP